jgi:Fur family ferric uptake transcriptional regulator
LTISRFHVRIPTENHFQLEIMNLNTDQLGHELATRGYKLTAPRRAVLDVIAGMCESLSPAEIYERARRRYPRLGLVTVYRTLDILVEVGVLRRVHLDDGCHSYAPIQAAHGHHLICSTCNQVVEFDGCDLDALFKSVARKTGFRIEGHWLELFGRCPKCQ